MTAFTLTSEQKRVIHHPLGFHARVLAVAGSGKTTTMAYRIKHLITKLEISPESIRVLMFNRLAREQFIEHLINLGLPTNLQPRVHTFHGFSARFISHLVSKQKIPNDLNYWVDDKEELIKISILNAINNLERNGIIQDDDIDIEVAMEAISLWKGSLIPPSRAGFRGNDKIPLVYNEYEAIRVSNNGVTYDDFVPIAIAYLENDRETRREWCSNVQFVIVDEYQDINYGQQRLIELLAGNQADVMVVGDDDQTIYEWRGARPNYIINKFHSVFHTKPHKAYQLSNSFRFGPVIAQCAFNTISFNTNRVEKPLVSKFIEKEADLHVVETTPGQETDANKEITQQIALLVKSGSVEPSKIIVLCRMFAQLSGIQTQFLTYKIPFYVLGQQPFWNRTEVRALLEYFKFAINLNNIVNNYSKTWLVNIINKPSRKIKRTDIANLMDKAGYRQITNFQALKLLINDPESSLYVSQQKRVEELIELLENVKLRIEEGIKAGELIQWIVNRLNYLDHFDNYYGKGEDSYDRKETIINFITYAKNQNQPVVQFLQHIDKLDPTRGVPKDQQIVMTTVFRIKGLEYEYVFIPDCTEGFFPCLYDSSNKIYDKEGYVQEPIPSESLENERRLFYVAVTRAEKGVYIGTTNAMSNSQRTSKTTLPSRFIDEMQYQPTSEIMKPLQQIAAGDLSDYQYFLSAVEKNLGMKQIIQYVLDNYLIELDCNDTREKIRQLIATNPIVPFHYRYDYSSKSKQKNKAQNNKPRTLHDAWDEIDF